MAPKDDTYMADVNPTFTWSNTGADSYTLEISKTSDFSGDVIRITGLTDTTYTPETPLESFTEYYWRVTAVTGGEEPITSAETFMLTTESEDIEGNVYYAKNFGLVEGIFSEEIPEERAIAQHNAAIIQNLLDKAGKKGGGTVILPEGDFCLCGDYTTYDARILYIRYDNVTLTGQGRDENGVYKTGCTPTPDGAWTKKFTATAVLSLSALLSDRKKLERISKFPTLRWTADADIPAAATGDSIPTSTGDGIFLTRASLCPKMIW
ncbi:MAG: hypothetical protein ACLTDS_16425 [Bianqueaceae bacterium]